LSNHNNKAKTERVWVLMIGFKTSKYFSLKYLHQTTAVNLLRRIKHNLEQHGLHYGPKICYQATLSKIPKQATIRSYKISMIHTGACSAENTQMQELTSNTIKERHS